MKKTNQLRKYIQGDVILRQVAQLPDGVAAMAPDKTAVAKILQKSEVTGHHHQFAPTATVSMFTSSRDTKALEALDFTTITPNEGKYIEVKETTFLYHGTEMELDPAIHGTGDHCAIQVEPGIYEVDIVRKFDLLNHLTTRVRD